MLVTSRGTGRWVLPKGNRMKGVVNHAAAELEALEEGGVVGSICPAPLGSYQYRKQLNSGASLQVEVVVFPLAVTQELDSWKEEAQRTRRWFSLREAAENVAEPGLRDLMRGFSPADFTAAASGLPLPGGFRSVREGFRMFHWFQALLPRQGQFFDLFEAHAQTVTAGGDALSRLFQGGAGMAQHVKEIVEREEEADTITREVLVSVRKTFLTPFDRGAIISLIGAMDDAIDQMQQTAGAIDLYDVREFTQEMRDMTAIIVDASRLIAEALPMLRDIHGNAARLHELTERLVRMEGQADDIHAKGLKNAFKQFGKTDTMRFIVEREIYSHLEKVVDKFEDVANEIDGLVIDHA
ncbi:DUF47 family protein [Novosphingobium sp. FSY-8]|uniref:DUF47 family protein n=1 Tax=Novosphingobium ovatum TaxID=1908523 RepID=A0ABW9X914_9SPHN|nr:DUF47 family protein [Novosphingobium ovatum]